MHKVFTVPTLCIMSICTVLRKEDLEAIAGAFGLLRDGRITDLSVKVKAHLEDPETHSTLANNLASL
jgi:hypothetical protein